MITTLIIIGLLVLAYLAFTTFYPSFGADISKEKQLTYQNSAQYKDGKFNNTKAVPKELSFKEKLDVAYYFFTTKVENGRPKEDLKVQKIDSIDVADYKGEARLVWFGHSAFLLQIDGKTILLDPMFGKVAAPHPLLGADRFNSEMPIAIEKLPFIDAVIFSHDHYDHLDYETVMKIKDKTKHFYTPLGVGEHLKAWGIPASKISELDWWQEIKFETLTLACTPAQHFSGRKLNNGQSTLWSSWVIQSKEENLFFSGDSGYAPHFKEIGNKYGPFDLALMECGQYNDKWSDIHMMPEETAQAGMDVRAKKIMPIHWGGFKLAMHDWKDPIKRVQAKAKQFNLEVITPKIGQEILVKEKKSYSNWWENL
ncbi:MBL fold metallo-hydrolase [Frigoriflavimonas asaccharolytica]|uniref:L-ascorbate metabolism protein UlaG (Beta-lactamase superfamily) n=1 Tax=Frigoriflavimonas asaccharolytica TaxID=2735899 RepID=A0A8J8G6F5_9FLAO|nr:MBL fold metallo-hydrolase [Frigoriflavimonas asaccharolytica]NRS92124.1 L-ascorbate metabolism protein UlaG (beta-lactamase superfamily) [Frigoriflavimonas asaccharolytica]